jgi:hypothetical protein
VDGRLNDKLKAYFKDVCCSKQEEIIKKSNNLFDLNRSLGYDYNSVKLLQKIEYYESIMKHCEKHIQPNISEIRNKSLDERFHTDKDNKEIDNNFDL